MVYKWWLLWLVLISTASVVHVPCIIFWFFFLKAESVSINLLAFIMSSCFESFPLDSVKGLVCLFLYFFLICLKINNLPICRLFLDHEQPHLFLPNLISETLSKTISSFCMLLAVSQQLYQCSTYCKNAGKYLPSRHSVRVASILKKITQLYKRASGLSPSFLSYPIPPTPSLLTSQLPSEACPPSGSSWGCQQFGRSACLQERALARRSPPTILK